MSTFKVGDKVVWKDPTHTTGWHHDWQNKNIKFLLITLHTLTDLCLQIHTKDGGVITTFLNPREAAHMRLLTTNKICL